MQEVLVEAAVPGIALIWMVKATVVLLVAWFVVSLARYTSAAVRHGIWAFSLAAILLLPVADRLLPPVSVTLPAFFAVPAEEEAALPVVTSPTVAPRVQETGVIPAFGPAEQAERVTPAPVDPPGFSPDWALILLGLWEAGCAARLAWLAMVLVRPRRLAWRTARPVAEPYARLARHLAKEVGIRRPVRVMEGTFFSMPLTWGVFRPVIVLPAGADRWPAERLRVVLLHELAHIRRWDYLTSITSEVACAAYWPLPLVWYARRRLQSEQEQACDDRVISVGTSPLVYADHLLAIARAFYGRRSDLGLTVTMAREVSLKHRVRAILDEQTDRRPLRSWEGVAAAAVLVATTLPVAALHAGSPDDRMTPIDEPADAAGEPRSRVPVASGPASLWFEAEWGSIAGAGAVGAELDASEAAYLTLRNRPGETTRASYRFHVANPGEYRIWARVRRGESDRTILHAAIGTDPGVETPIEWGPPGPPGGWRWISIGGDGLNDDVTGTVQLAPGGHTLSVRPTEGDIRIDRIVVSDDSLYVPTGRGPINPAIRPAYHLLEAESGQVVGAASAARGGNASAERYLHFNAPRLGERSGRVDYVVDIEQPGRYIIWGRISAPAGQTASMWVQVNDNPVVTWDGPSVDWRWEWDAVNGRRRDSDAIDPMVFNLKAGRNTLAFQARSPGVRLDAILVTNDLAHRPLGLWPASVPAVPQYLWLEAEDGGVAEPFVVESGTDISGGRVVSVSDQVTGEPGQGGTLRFQVTTPDAGIYSLWGRTLAGGAGANSMYIRVDGGEWILWNRIPDRGTWIWYPVLDAGNGGQMANFQLSAGTHVVEVSGRDPGIKLDRLLLTNDPLIGADAITAMGLASRVPPR